MIIKIKDLNSDKDGFSSEQKVKVSFDTDSMAMSSIELVEKYSTTITKGPFTKSGIDIIPNISNFYPETKNEILFYSEIYNSNKELNNEKFLVKYYIADYQTLAPNPNFIGYIRQNPSKVGIVLRKFNIEKLKTGNYFLVIEIRDKNNVLQKNQSIFLQRHNPKMDVSKLAKICFVLSSPWWIPTVYLLSTRNAYFHDWMLTTNNVIIIKYFNLGGSYHA